jgi:hypothetical protein
MFGGLQKLCSIKAPGKATVRERSVHANGVIAMTKPQYHLGIDFGTSGARATVINGEASRISDKRS